ncbi:MAG: TonB-dependent receptor [Gammaproteobacteria bacterium]|nr:TonB-dependent receptor [Gammaproteobacteria bacterium]
MTCAFKKYVGIATVLFLTSAGGLEAQTATGSASPGGASSGTDVLEEVVVGGVRLEDQVSPLQRRVSSVLGIEMSVLDTPRSVTEINSAQIRDESIVDVTDFDKITSSAYTNNQFGGPNVPFLRGQAAEVFQNGMLRTPRSDGQPLSFNSVEGFDIVKGPADVVYGPTGSVGGYVNLVTKRPYFDGQHTTTTLTYGSYATRKAQLDVSGPVSDKLAYRVSYEGNFSGSYYRYGYDHSSDVYAALRYLPNSQLTIDFNAEFYTAHYTENTGINRPTQLLIDQGLYYQGTGVSPFTGSGQDPRGFLSVVDVTAVVPINRSYQLVAPDDHDKGSNFQAQLDITDVLSDTLTLANKAYFEDYSQLQLEYAQRYYNNIRESYNFEDRLELRGNFAGNQFITGLAYRFMHVLAYGDFFNEYLNATDITGNPAAFPITTNLFGVLPVPGSPSQFATPGASYDSAAYPNSILNTQDQTSNQVGVFFQDVYQLTSRLSVLGGVRVDVIHESLTDPLPPPGFAAAHATTTQGEEAVDASITYKTAPWNTLYVTADFNESPVTTNGGGFAGFTGDTILASDFHIKNFLYEAGSKTALADNTLYLTSAAFLQKRSQNDQFGNTTRIEALGAELEANYQPNRNFSATAAYSYLNARLPGAGGSLAFTRNVYDAFAPPYGNGTGSPNFSPLPVRNYRLPGVPSELFSAFTKYRTNLGLGASVGVVVTGPINTSYLGNVTLPTQYTLDSTLFYETTRWGVHANFYNVTNRKNWIAQSGAVGNDLIAAALPFHFQASVNYRF